MRELEIEYKKQLDLELPDLWSRIEAGVDEYEANNIVSLEEKKKKRRATMYLIGKCVAAAAVLFVMINVFSLFGHRNMSSPASETTMNFAASDSAPAMEEATGSSSTAMEESACEDIVEAEDDISLEIVEEAESTDEATNDTNIAESAVEDNSVKGESTENKGVSVQKTEKADDTIAEIYDSIYLNDVMEIWECNTEQATKIMSALAEENVPRIVEFELAEGDAATDAKGIDVKKITCDNGAEYYVFVDTDHDFEVINIKIIK